MTKTLLIFCLTFATIIVSAAKSDEKDLVRQPERQLAIEKINESLAFIEKSKKEDLSGNSLKSRQYIRIAEIKLQASQSLLRSYLIKTDKAKLQNNLTSLRSKNKKLKEQFKDNVSELKQYKDKATLSNELIYNNSLNNLESALSQINDAEQVDATIYSSDLLSKAHDHYNKATESHNKGLYEESVIDSELSMEFAKQAVERSANRYKEKENLTNSLTNIFGFSSDTINSSITLSSEQIFSPQSSSIRFDLYPSLDKIAGTLKDYQNLNIEVKAYNNGFKSSKENVDLSNKQIETIKGYLISRGISENAFIEKEYSKKEIIKQRKIEIILNN